MQIEYRLKPPGILLSLNNDWPATAGAVFFFNYIGMDRLKICTECVLVCAGPIASPLASAASHLFFYFCLSAHTIHVFKFFIPA